MTPDEWEDMFTVAHGSFDSASERVKQTLLSMSAACRRLGQMTQPLWARSSSLRMPSEPNVVLRGGPADGQVSYLPALGDPMPFEDVGGGSITYVDSGELEQRGGIKLRVYVPNV